VTTKGKRRKRRPPKWRPQELLLGRFFWCRPRFVSAQSGNFALILADAAGLTTRVLFRLCGWTGLVSRQPLNTGSAVRRPGGLRESCRSCDDSSNEKNSRERTDLRQPTTAVNVWMFLRFMQERSALKELEDGFRRPPSRFWQHSRTGEMRSFFFTLYLSWRNPISALLVSFAAKAKPGDSNA
jgi:hypothetical protein